ncbi:MAG: hypothetical protein GY862_17635 [Gammaproteobacteria bacterium]|nr:hypothetical protein [Gammaproteobacteria bacterium]
MASRSFVSQPGDTPDNMPYPALVRGVPEFSADISKSQNWGALDIRNTGTLDAWLEYGWGGREIRLGLGGPSWPLSDFRFVSLRAAKLGMTAPNKNTLQLFFHDAGTDIDAPIQTSLLENGDPVPLCYGTCFNLEPAFLGEDINGAHYQAHDGAVDSITVRSGGLSVSGVSLDLENGKLTIDPPPTGRVTCDVVNSGYSTAADIIEEIITGPLGLPAGRINSANFAAFNTAAPYGLGVYVKKRTNSRKLIRDIIRSFAYRVVFRMYLIDTKRKRLSVSVRIAASQFFPI